MEKLIIWSTTNASKLKKQYAHPYLKARFEYLLNLYIDNHHKITYSTANTRLFHSDIHLFKNYYINGTNIRKIGSNNKIISVQNFLYNKFDKQALIDGIIVLQDYEQYIEIIVGPGNGYNIINITNATIRQEALNYYGVEKFFKEMNTKIIHEKGRNQLLTLRWHNAEEPLTMVKVIDSTTKDIYLLRVPPTMKTVEEAVAWTFNMDREEYKPIKET